MICNLCRSERFEDLPFHYVWEDRTFRGRRCRDCRLVAVDPLPTDAELGRLYGADYFRDGLHGLDRAGTDYEALADARLPDLRRFIRERVRPAHPEARRLFEIGAAMGHFLAAARDEGYECRGLELSPAAVARAREKFGLDLAQGNIEDFAPGAEAGRWDVVYCGDLFEHLRDPAGVLDTVADLLAPDGLCVMRLPGTFNLLSTRLAVPALRLLGRDRRLPDPPYHLYEYTTATARRMFGRRFARVTVHNEATPPGRLNLKDGSPAYLAKYLLQYVNRPLTRLTNRWGDRMLVVARKGIPAAGRLDRAGEGH